ncbi:MAG: segregation/condensation protein A [Candidatus Marinimicrobia bacterium]|nr:segregation/condensation protein A [Candidatus Neomarinimicrobiota bacterium]
MNYKIHLDVFEGPVDLLLYFIKRDEINIYDIPIMKITRDYLEYLEMMKTLNLQTAGEFVAMAALLMRIKAKMLIQRVQEAIENEEIEESQERTCATASGIPVFQGDRRRTQKTGRRKCGKISAETQLVLH